MLLQHVQPFTQLQVRDFDGARAQLQDGHAQPYVPFTLQQTQKLLAVIGWLLIWPLITCAMAMPMPMIAPTARSIVMVATKLIYELILSQVTNR